MKEIVEQMKMFEEFVNGVPKAIKPCKLCKNCGEVYAECCWHCCYFYASSFEADKTKMWTQKEQSTHERTKTKSQAILL